MKALKTKLSSPKQEGILQQTTFGRKKQLPMVCLQPASLPHQVLDSPSLHNQTSWIFDLTATTGDLQDGGGVRCGDHVPPHKYIKNTSTCGTTPTEHLLNPGRRPQISQKAWVSQSHLISHCFNPILSGWKQKSDGNLHAEVGQKPKLNPRSCVNKEQKEKFLHAASWAVD